MLIGYGEGAKPSKPNFALKAGNMPFFFFHFHILKDVKISKYNYMDLISSILKRRKEKTQVR